MIKYATPQKIRQSVIGNANKLHGPFGPKPIVYADTTASGKAVSFIEDYIQDVVLPFYANTHTESSATGLQTQSFREDARNVIRRTFNAPKEEYVVIFAGSGSTGAMNKLANALGISPLAPRVDDPSKRAVVFISSQEHDSNELLWRESGNVDCVVVPTDSIGLLDEDVLVEQLIRYQDRPLKFASLSAASNVTGIRYDTERITNILHDHGAWAAWDFAAAGSHVCIDMAGQDLDAVYLSPHKYVGGPGTPGVLVARRSLFTNEAPTTPGGGTVVYVQPHAHKYLDDIEAREEGGTPAIIDSIRCGLALELHDKVGPKWIEKQESYFLDLALKAWDRNKNIVVLGNTDVKRVSIVSFLVKSPNGDGFLHYNFVVALLNDLFGIQTRGGCSCAGPYGHLLLNFDKVTSDIIVEKMDSIGEAVKPGWTRLSFSYYMSLETVKYIIKAVDLVANEGFKLLPKYNLNPKTGAWTHQAFVSQPMKLWDFSIPYFKPKSSSRKDLKVCMIQAKRVLRSQKVPTIRRVTESFMCEEFSTQRQEHKHVSWFVVSEKAFRHVSEQWFRQRMGHASFTDTMATLSDHEEDDPTVAASTPRSRSPEGSHNHLDGNISPLPLPSHALKPCGGTQSSKTTMNDIMHSLVRPPTRSHNCFDCNIQPSPLPVPALRPHDGAQYSKTKMQDTIHRSVLESPAKTDNVDGNSPPPSLPFPALKPHVGTQKDTTKMNDTMHSLIWSQVKRHSHFDGKHSPSPLPFPSIKRHGLTQKHKTKMNDSMHGLMTKLSSFLHATSSDKEMPTRQLHSPDMHTVHKETKIQTPSCAG